MDDTLRAELLARADADSTAVAAFLAAADNWRTTFEARSETPWPYVLLEWTPAGSAPTPVRRVLEVVHDNVQWLRGVVETRGWPGKSLVGEDGVDAAWLLLQHAGSGVPSIGTPENLRFQASCLPLLRASVDTGESHPRHLAHVADNLRQRAGEKPVYAAFATAFVTDNDELVLRPDLEAAAIDAERREIGLQALVDDLALRRAGTPPDAWGEDRPEPWPGGRR
ncbi:DUF6624 domain-containing protein [Kribbella italica]|uniref:Uncharacterized protein n=1 Tax=Kribbella italica TaxID=1540520 RepID=A0A7W9J4R0_9ACTN|nr:DUF6624 domain-containing protein [Kribbella italica]MBB5834868.1 hypothetical protein [Kribbella italica]